MKAVLPILFLAACGVILYSGFCRLVHMQSDTRFSVRGAIWFLTVVAVTSIFSVTVWGPEPHWVATLLAMAIAGVQVATSRLWASGVPDQYRASAPNPGERMPAESETLGSSYGWPS